MSLDVIIPVYKPDKKFDQLFRMLLMQSVKPDEIIVLNTETEDFPNEAIVRRLEKQMKKQKIYGKKQIDVRVVAIRKEEFDHGGTRRYGVSLSNADYFVMMTQDAVPADDYLLERLLGGLQQEACAMAYARQGASLNSSMVEQYTRLFNYPKTSSVKSKKDLERLGIKTYFCSDVCAAYRRSAYEEVGGFVEKTIFNEDAIIAARLIEADYRIAYVAEAKVIHSHNYTLREQLKRNFDLGVSHAEYREIFAAVPAEKEGSRLVLQTLEYLMGQRRYLDVLDLIFQSAAKFIGYQFGKHYRMLPKELVLKLSSNPGYFMTGK
ncbi:MAG: glycosyltransferase family 2 protein [Lachnospiraceae bacterium]|nr:glycosyltransferase family 2 protein [Lachnospiraceae bacterium]